MNKANKNKNQEKTLTTFTVPFDLEELNKNLGVKTTIPIVEQSIEHLLQRGITANKEGKLQEAKQLIEEAKNHAVNE